MRRDGRRTDGHCATAFAALQMAVKVDENMDFSALDAVYGRARQNLYKCLFNTHG